ncbi:MAG: hypothetical protein ABIS36_23250 [Chryseolinea sp.]
MSKIENNPLFKGVSGKLGDVIVIRQSQRGIVMANKPRKAKTVTESQLARRSTFQDASHYALRQLAKPEARALYESRVNIYKNSAYLVAISDYLSLPKVQLIDTESYTGAVGQSINVKATDDFQVTTVSVVIKSASGVELERGQATLSIDLRDQWVYTTTAVNATLVGSTVTASATDLAGNTTSKVSTL